MLRSRIEDGCCCCEKLCVTVNKCYLLLRWWVEGRGARYRETRCDSYRKRCGCEAVSCGVTAVASEGALLLVLRLVNPLVLLSRGVRLLITVSFFYFLFSSKSYADRFNSRLQLSRGSMSGKALKKDSKFGWAMTETTWVSYLRSVCYRSDGCRWSIVDTRSGDYEQRPWRKKCHHVSSGNDSRSFIFLTFVSRCIYENWKSVYYIYSSSRSSREFSRALELELCDRFCHFSNINLIYVMRHNISFLIQIKLIKIWLKFM